MPAALHRPRRVVASLGALCLVVGVAACGGDSSPAETVTVTETADAPLTQPEQQQKTTEQLEAALPTMKDMPEDFLEDVSPPGDETRESDPAQCNDMYFVGEDARAFAKDHDAAQAQIRAGRAQTKGGGIIGVFVYSFDEPYPMELFDAAGEAVSPCASFRTKVGGSFDDTTTEVVAVPQLGDRTFGARLVTPDYQMDRMSIRSGHNRIDLLYLSYEKDMKDELLGDLAEGVLERLAKG